MGRIEALLIVPVTAFDLAVVAWSVGTNELVPDAELKGGVLKQSRNIPFGVGKTVSKLKAVVSLDTLDVNTSASIPLDQPFEKISRGVGGLFGVGSEEAQTSELIDSGILE